LLKLEKNDVVEKLIIQIEKLFINKNQNSSMHKS